MRFPKIFNRFKSRDKPLTGSSVGFLFGRTSSGKSVNERTALSVTGVYACVRIISESVAGLPFQLLEYSSSGTRKAVEHPLYYLLHDAPNPEMTSFTFRETLMAHLLLWGNAYAQIIRDGRGRVLELYPLLPDRMTVDRSPTSGAIVYSYLDGNGITHPLRHDEVLHIPGLGFDGLIGYSPIAMAKDAIGIALATEEYGSKFFSNGGRPGGTLEHPGVIKDKKKLREDWDAAYGGSNAGNTAVLEEGMKDHPITFSPEDAQFLETRKFQLNEIARIFRIPPHMIGDLEKSSFNNIEQQSLEFVQYTLDPWNVRIEQAVKKDLLLPSERTRYFAKLNVDGLLRGDYEKRQRGYALGRQNGWLSPNDVLRMEDKNLIPAEQGGDDYHLNGNMVKLADAGAAYRKKNGLENGGEQN
jgi:HK97 family phage portal protein